MKIRSLLFLLLSLLLSVPLSAQPLTSGPENGSLIIMGGAASDTVFMNHFARLAGGLDARVVVIPSASSDGYLESDGALERIRQRFTEYGFTDVGVLHTRSRKEADSRSFAARLDDVEGIWFTGGRQWRVTKTYLDTRTEKAIWEVVNRGGVIAGSSAGASLQASFLVRGENGDNTVMMGDYQEGFGFLSNAAVDQHLLARNRQFDLFGVLRKHDELLGIGIDENTGIIVQHDRFRVIGNSYVAIYDGTRWSAERDTIYSLEEGQEQFYLLEPGQDYQLHERRILFPEDRQAIEIAPERLERLTGTYRLPDRPQSYLTVTLNDNVLTVTPSGNTEEFRAMPESELRFFNRSNRMHLTFQTDRHGRIVALDTYRFGRTRWEKVD